MCYEITGLCIESIGSCMSMDSRRFLSRNIIFPSETKIFLGTKLVSISNEVLVTWYSLWLLGALRARFVSVLADPI